MTFQRKLVDETKVKPSIILLLYYYGYHSRWSQDSQQVSPGLLLHDRGQPVSQSKLYGRSQE